MKTIHTLSVLFGLAAAAGSALAGDIYVIANSGTSITAGDVKDVFTGEKQLAGSTKLIPIDNAAAQGDMLSKVLGMDLAKYNGIWTKKSFRDGANPPSVKSGDLEVVEFVKKTPGAVGYVSSNPSGVSVVQKF